jgi:hypothetical protein
MGLELVLAVLVLALALAALAYPLYRARSQGLLVTGSTLDDLLAQRDGVYATLRDLELDQQLGKLDAADYNALRDKYIQRATEILRQLDALRGEGGAKEASDEIERQVAAMRRLEPAVAERPARLNCPNCARPYLPDDKFCARCGHALTRWLRSESNA